MEETLPGGERKKMVNDLWTKQLCLILNKVKQIILTRYICIWERVGYSCILTRLGKPFVYNKNDPIIYYYFKLQCTPFKFKCLCPNPYMHSTHLTYENSIIINKYKRIKVK